MGRLGGGGGAGTLSEIGFTLKLHKPLVLLGSWKIEPPSGSDPLPVSPRVAQSPEEAVRLALRSDPDTSSGNWGYSWEFGSGVGIRGHALGGPSEAAGARLSRSLPHTQTSWVWGPCPLALRDGPLTPPPDPSSRKSPCSRLDNGMASRLARPQ